MKSQTTEPRALSPCLGQSGGPLTRTANREGQPEPQAPSETKEKAMRGEVERQREREDKQNDLRDLRATSRRAKSMVGRKACTEEDRASPSLLQVGGRRQDSRAEKGLLSGEGKAECEGRGRRSCPMLTSPHLTMGQRPGWLKEVRKTSASVPGQGSHSDRAKMKAAVSKERASSPSLGASPQVCGRLGSEITGANLSCSSACHLHV